MTMTIQFGLLTPASKRGLRHAEFSGDRRFRFAFLHLRNRLHFLGVRQLLQTAFVLPLLHRYHLVSEQPICKIKEDTTFTVRVQPADDRNRRISLITLQHVSKLPTCFAKHADYMRPNLLAQNAS